MSDNIEGWDGIGCDCDGHAAPKWEQELMVTRDWRIVRCKETNEIIWPFQKRYYIKDTYVEITMDVDAYYNHKGMMIQKLKGEF